MRYLKLTINPQEILGGAFTTGKRYPIIISNDAYHFINDDNGKYLGISHLVVEVNEECMEPDMTLDEIHEAQDIMEKIK